MTSDVKPFDELVFHDSPDTEIFSALYEFGGFPEPLIKQNHRFLRRWQNERTERLFKEDLQVNFRTVANWLDTFELFYYCFRIPPYQSKKIASVRKEKKLYLWDWSVIEEEGKNWKIWLPLIC